ncbi:hypothetical protein TrVE_jg10525 [Triparma verrucosa]|uniref:Uncharacterized protein n=1 Tax=Triparma verrucosa TaxID=1606542 RepID=A0A9W7KWP8_9STRA|nr:hypothetical protein TrVE_jg10525 [Triparma verrucosa]
MYANLWHTGFSGSMEGDYCDDWTSWTFTTWTYASEADELKLYINGQLSGQATHNTAEDRGTGNFTALNTDFIYVGSGYNVMHGGMDSFAVYDYTMTEAQVISDFEANKVFNRDEANANLVLFYGFDTPGDIGKDEFSGTYDALVGHNNDATEPVCEIEAKTCYNSAMMTSPIAVPYEAASSRINHAPTLVGATSPDFSKVCARGSSVEIFMVKYGHDPDGDDTEIWITTLPLHGTLSERRAWSNRKLKKDITADMLPYQMDFGVSSLEYAHIESSVTPVASDLFTFHFSDASLSSTTGNFHIELIGRGAIPTIAANSTNNTFTVRDKQNASFAVDFGSRTGHLPVLIKKLPSNGTLYALEGDQRYSPLTVHFSQHPYVGEMISEYASKIVNVSSYWHDATGSWGPQKILGASDCDVAYRDCSNAWCPALMTGESLDGVAMNTYTNDKGEVVTLEFTRPNWNAAESMLENGYNEYIEVSFETPMYVTQVEVGEPRGCGSITKILLKEHGGTGVANGFFTPVDTRCDPTSKILNKMRIFEPHPVCHSPFLTDRIQLQLDTTSVTDWNEFDYVRISGYTEPPIGVLLVDTEKDHQVKFLYVPDPDFEGTDSIVLSATDCGYEHSRETAKLELNFDVLMDEIVCPEGM